MTISDRTRHVVLPLALCDQEASDELVDAIDAGGGPTTSPGCLVKTTVLTNMSGTFTTGLTTNTLRVRGVAGGGGGGGANSISSSGACGGGGGSGAYAEMVIDTAPSTDFPYTCGALGTGGVGISAGVQGGSSTFGDSTLHGTLFGGFGGEGGSGSVPALQVFLGGAGGPASGGGAGDRLSKGAPGGNGITLTTNGGTGATGFGGSSPMGGGGESSRSVSNGNWAGAGFGAGGAGAKSQGAVTKTGGGGSAGCWVVDEYT